MHAPLTVSTSVFRQVWFYCDGNGTRLMSASAKAGFAAKYRRHFAAVAAKCLHYPR